jgi:hypothetical protein
MALTSGHSVDAGMPPAFSIFYFIFYGFSLTPVSTGFKGDVEEDGSRQGATGRSDPRSLDWLPLMIAHQ